MTLTDLTESEVDMIESMRDDIPCIVFNDEAAERLSDIASKCDCPGCKFIRDSLDAVWRPVTH